MPSCTAWRRGTCGAKIRATRCKPRRSSTDARKYQLVELRFFGGLSNEEVAEVMGLSLRTVEREWQRAKLWLHRAIGKNESDEASP